VKPKSFAKLLVFINALVPLAVLIYDKSTDHLGADPANYLLQVTGLLAILFLIFSLAITPMRRLTGQNYYSLFRRMLGLYGFFYASCHLLIFIFVFKAGVFADVLADIVKTRNLIGLAAFLLLVPLALTSTAGSIKRLGAKNWKLLHKLVYVSIILAAVHYCLATKTIGTQQKVFTAIITVLLLFRPAAYFWDQAAHRRKAQPARKTEPVA